MSERGEPEVERELEVPPEGARCAEHPERPALVVCPRCGSFACLACWQGPVRRCHACLMRDPAGAAPPLPWERADLGLASRFFGTLRTALSPTRSAPAFLSGDHRRGWVFALLTFLPLALLEGIVPYTHTLAFGPSFGLALLGTPSGADIALDIAQASGLGLAMTLAKLLALLVPYHSLSRAYASKGNPSAALKLFTYRAWLIPLGGVMLWVFVWSLPLEPGEMATLAARVAPLLPLVLLLSSMLSTARIASGVGPFATYVVAIVPFVLYVLVEPLAATVAAPLMPDPEMVRAVTGG